MQNLGKEETKQENLYGNMRISQNTDINFDNTLLRPPNGNICVNPNLDQLNEDSVNCNRSISNSSCNKKCEKCQKIYIRRRNKLLKRFCNTTSAHGFHNLVDSLESINSTNYVGHTPKKTFSQHSLFGLNYNEYKHQDSNVQLSVYKKSVRGSITSIINEHWQKARNRPRPGITRGRRLLWLFIMMGAAIGFSIHLTFLGMRYSEMRVNTQSETMATPFVFPDVTICPTGTFSQVRVSKNPRVPSLDMTFKELQDKINKFWRTIDEASDEENLTAESLLTTDTLNSLKKYLHEVNVTTQHQDIIWHCDYKGQSADCSFANFTMEMDPFYLGCFNFSPDDPYLIRGGEIEGGLKVILYLGDGFANMSDEEALDYFKGVRVVIHPKGTRPNFKTDGFYAEVGHNTIVQLGYTQMHLLNKPARNCSEKNEQIVFVNGFDSMAIDKSHIASPHAPNKSFIYTLEDCLICEYQEHLLKECECISETFAVPISMESQTKNFCHRIDEAMLTARDDQNKSPEIEKLSQRVSKRRKCHDDSINSIHQKTAQANQIRCPFPCDSQQYTMRITRVNWPAANITQVERRLLEAKKVTVTKAKMLGYGTEVLETIGDHINPLLFLKLSIYGQSTMGDRVEEAWVYPARNLFSDLGGILGLWLGVSTITIFEFFELFFNLFSQILQRYYFKTTKKKLRNKTKKMKIQLSIDQSEENAIQTQFSPKKCSNGEESQDKLKTTNNYQNFELPSSATSSLFHVKNEKSASLTNSRLELELI